MNMEAEKREKNPHAVALGRLGGLKGGPARMAAMTPKERMEQAMTAVEARWGPRPMTHRAFIGQLRLRLVECREGLATATTVQEIGRLEGYEWALSHLITHQDSLKDHWSKRKAYQTEPKGGEGAKRSD